MVSRLTTFIVFLAVLSSFIVAADPCKFQHATKGVIDLTSLSNNDGKPAYPDRVPSTASNYKYSYNPCKPFSEGTTCVNVAACQVSMDGQYTFVLGTQESAVWDDGARLGSTPSVAYSNDEKKVTVSLQCGTEGVNEFEALGEDPINNYKFRLKHKCACWDGCGGAHPETTTKSGGGGGGGGIAGGAVFIIILAVLLVVYFVGFALLYRFHQQKSGVELIAHRGFWVALPGYAKDGVVYLVHKVTNKGGGASYQSV